MADFETLPPVTIEEFLTLDPVQMVEFAGGSPIVVLGWTPVAGPSAYELAVSEGFVGTLEEYLESLHGQQGDPGPQGIPGPQGESPWVEMTQAAYDLITPEPDTWYVIVG